MPNHTATNHKLTTSDDFRCDDRTVTLPRNAFAAIAEALAEYQDYAEDMRAFGRGFSPCNPFGPETLRAIIKSALAGDGPTPTTPKPTRRARTIQTVPASDVDTSQMTDAELRKHYTKTAPVEDVRFFIRVHQGPCIPEAEALLAVLLANGGKATPETKAAYKRLHAHSRAWHNAQDAWKAATAQLAADEADITEAA